MDDTRSVMTSMSLLVLLVSGVIVRYTSLHSVGLLFVHVCFFILPKSTIIHVNFIYFILLLHFY